MAKDNEPKVEKTKAELIADLMLYKNSAKGQIAISEISANKSEMIKAARAAQEKNK
jgi:hypothetical protein